MEQTRGLFCTCDAGVARCQLQQQTVMSLIRLVAKVAVVSMFKNSGRENSASYKRLIALFELILYIPSPIF